MTDRTQRQRWWQTLPGVLTACAALITAIGGLIAVWPKRDAMPEPARAQPGLASAATMPNSTTPTTTATAVTVVDTDTSAIAGRWSGEAKDARGAPYRIEVSIDAACGLHQFCGRISVSHVPCHGRLTLVGVTEGDFEFNVDAFDASSSEACTPGAGEHFKVVGPNQLSYFASYSHEAAILTRVTN